MSIPAKAHKKYYETGLAALKRGEVAVSESGRRRGLALDPGRGRRESLAPLLQTRRAAIAPLSKRTSPRAGALVNSRALPCPTSSAPATSRMSRSRNFLQRQNNYGYPGPLLLSPGRSIGLRFVPTVRDLRFMWEEMPQQMLDEQAQKVRDSLRTALLGWARQAGEASDYTDNVPLQCLHPVGHWFEIPNLLRNGVFAELLDQPPAAQIPDAAQHRYPRRGRRSHPARPAHRTGRLPHASRSSLAGSKTAAAVWLASMAASAWSKVWPCRARRPSSASPTTTP